MKCPICAAEVVEKSVFCHQCGERLAPDDGSTAESRESGADGDGESSSGDDSSERTANERFRGAMGRSRGNGEPAEEELWSGGYCGRAMMGSWILGLLATLSLVILAVMAWNTAALRWIVLAAMVAMWGYLVITFARRRLGVHYRLTTQRFFHEKGILVHTTDLIEVIDMDDITYSQTLIDRLFGVGTIRIVSSDRSHPDLAVPGIAEVKDVAAMMQEARHAERLRRGVHIESI
ncbi:MAG TPA: PH domain-containing protein [Thermoguttaceae bacterium]|nr:PH domain-containing protein [Thermoguttaceae bacterium]